MHKIKMEKKFKPFVQPHSSNLNSDSTQLRQSWHCLDESIARVYEKMWYEIAAEW